MFNFLKKHKREKSLLQNWQISVDDSYRFINNGDSIQFVNADETRILYFSILTITGKPLLTGELLSRAPVTVAPKGNGWQLKGTKQGDSEILVCVFDFASESDAVWAKGVFNAITYSKR